MALPPKYRTLDGVAKIASRTWKTQRDTLDNRTEPKVISVADAGAAVSLDWKHAVHSITLTEACTVSFNAASLVSGRHYKIRVWAEQDATGTWAITWPASVNWNANTEPTATLTGDTITVWEFETADAGTTVVGNMLVTAVPNA